MRVACSTPPIGWTVASPPATRPALVKDNAQLPEQHPVGRELGDIIISSLQKNALFVSAALPLRVFPPLFNRYRGGQSFGNHVDNAIRQTTNGATADPHRSVLYAVPRRSGGVRRRRVIGGGHLRRSFGQAPGRPHGALSIVQPAQRHASDPRRAGGVVLLVAEHDSRRWGTHAAVRPGHGHSATDRRHAQSPRCGAVDVGLSQPASALGAGVMLENCKVRPPNRRQEQQHRLCNLLTTAATRRCRNLHRPWCGCGCLHSSSQPSDRREPRTERPARCTGMRVVDVASLRVCICALATPCDALLRRLRLRSGF